MAQPPEVHDRSQCSADPRFTYWSGVRKAAVILDILKGVTSREALAEKHDLQVEEVDHWIDQFVSGGEENLKTSPREYPCDINRDTLNIYNARRKSEEFIETIGPYPERFADRGVVICAGGIDYFVNAWVSVNLLRHLGCALPVEIWHLGRGELDERMQSLMEPLGCRCIDATEVAREYPTRTLGGWELKSYAILHSSFREILFLDADNVAVVNPEFLFETDSYLATGAVFWPDRFSLSPAARIWRICGVAPQKAREFESGQMVVDKQRIWRALSLCAWYNAHSDFYYEWVYGDKDTFQMALRKTGTAFAMPKKGIEEIECTFCQHDFEGRRIFQHRLQDKWRYHGSNRRLPRFLYDKECHGFAQQLRDIWDGRLCQIAT